MRFAGSVAARTQRQKGRTVVQSFDFYDYLIRRRIVKLRLVFDALIDIRVND